MTKIVSQLDVTGLFVGPTEADVSPLEPGVFLIPGGAVDLPPPEVPAGHLARLVEGAWAFEALPVEPEDPEEPTIAPEAKLTRAIQDTLDQAARDKGYDNILSACSYAALPAGAPFQAEGAAFLVWRSAVWTKAYAVLADVQGGKRPMPTLEQALAEMPAWGPLE
ncbi:MAG: hypothetical protein V4451_16895 [Pseudomonadota bacterium]